MNRLSSCTKLPYKAVAVILLADMVFMLFFAFTVSADIISP